VPTEFLHVPANRRHHRNSHQPAKSSLPDAMSGSLNCGKPSFDLNDIIDRGIPSRIASNRLRLLHLGRGHDADVSVRSEVLSCEEGYNNNACYKHSKKIGAAKAIMFLPSRLCRRPRYRVMAQSCASSHTPCEASRGLASAEIPKLFSTARTSPRSRLVSRISIVSDTGFSVPCPLRALQGKYWPPEKTRNSPRARE
jgi:hypothetical protein